ncbi:vancomycin high temperature exclusion protein [Micromonospora olivasterospora]|uniref:Vancomycin permeability regulator SanA n=1 Tax=Micromonospora olivasterospora TaxID=1880 RepID=A0A562I636_MICOL|nr:ElyC/SanA/YdcF family protein [Micromonospora olivasterospora]TWH66471.1 vancomycin permeability regulator SanA [Micromonospora olivasterospora]
MRWRISTPTWIRQAAGARRLRLLALAALAGAVLATTGTAASVAWVRGDAEGHLFAERDVPEAPVALVLGTRVDPDGTPSPFLTARLEIARRLLAAGKVQAILLSGDNMHHDYNEPDAMRRWLLDRGVPARRLVPDCAGFDTYDSCARAKRIFGVDRATVVTQSFHLPRAVAVCRRLGVEANGVGDDTARAYARTWRVSATREYGACVKAALDVLSRRDPVHLGRRETGVDDALAGG